ncbi:MAG: hypothetical protein B6247_23640 [Candidatus Parabeggiatoa sp. nov. 2]|nr:MAG: hypothetical protein B6247_23640 [Beggiatoa sp. 4572_84]
MSKESKIYLGRQKKPRQLSKESKIYLGHQKKPRQLSKESKIYLGRQNSSIEQGVQDLSWTSKLVN